MPVTPKVSDKQIDLKCALCDKSIADKSPAGLTGWIFKDRHCTCLKRDPDLADNEVEDSTDAIEAESAELPDLGEKYEVLSVLGKGGMGAVYRVRDKELGKEFAIKLLRPELSKDQGAAKRFAQEAKACKDLTHVNLCAVYDNGTAMDGSPYMVMDYLDGETLAHVIQEHAYLEVPRALDIFIQICDALNHAHLKNVIHRDLKPSNIILTKSPSGGDIVKVLDFGIAKILSDGGKEVTRLTQTGDLFGSPLYMSPEQCKGEKLDASSDIYALGCVMYETLTGKSPFDAENAFKVMLKHVDETPAPLSKAF